LVRMANEPRTAEIGRSMQPPGDPTFIIDYTASLSCRVYAVIRRPGALQYSTEQLLTFGVDR
jgi:hypothetical protein